jgi:hypothetical protein
MQVREESMKVSKKVRDATFFFLFLERERES